MVGKNINLNIRITETMLEDLTRAAELASTTVSEIVRSRILMLVRETAAEEMANSYGQWAYKMGLINARQMGEITAKVKGVIQC